MIKAVMGTSKLGINLGHAEALAAWQDKTNIGTEIGNFIYYEQYKSEIIDKKDNLGLINLVGVGWVDIQKCRFFE